MLDYQEIKGSLGNSSLLMESKGHRIFFNIGKLPGYLEIKRSGWTGFEYGCLINGKVVKEVTQGVPENQDLLFQPKVADTTFTADEHSEYPIAWYVIRTRRITDGVQTTVHRYLLNMYAFYTVSAVIFNISTDFQTLSRVR